MKLFTDFDWRTWAALLAAGLFGIVAVVPFVLNGQPGLVADTGLSVPALVILAAAQNTVVLAIIVFLGLKAAKPAGLHIYGDGPHIRSGVIAGVGIALALLVLDWLGNRFLYTMPAASGPVWTGFLAAFYGGITEEILIRLFLMSVLVWLARKLMRRTGVPSDSVFWLAILGSALIFGLGHLPATAQTVALTPAIILRAIGLNGIAGVTLGWIFWRKNLVTAMIAHFSADIVLLVIVPVFVALT